jgi:hypothetical protein
LADLPTNQKVGLLRIEIMATLAVMAENPLYGRVLVLREWTD